MIYVILQRPVHSKTPPHWGDQTSAGVYPPTAWTVMEYIWSFMECARGRNAWQATSVKKWDVFLQKTLMTDLCLCIKCPQTGTVTFMQVFNPSFWAIDWKHPPVHSLFQQHYIILHWSLHGCGRGLSVLTWKGQTRRCSSSELPQLHFFVRTHQRKQSDVTNPFTIHDILLAGIP